MYRALNPKTVCKLYPLTPILADTCADLQNTGVQVILANYIRREWFGNVRGDLVAGIVTALALIPETIAFAIIAGVDPAVGLYASFVISVVIAFTGGRPGMISGAAGAMALVMVLFVREHGLEFLFAATVLTGIIQLLFGVLKFGRYLRFVPRSVMTGFVNSLAILIFISQLNVFEGAGWQTYAVVAAGIAIIYLIPLFFRAIPAPLIAIVALTVVTALTGSDVRTVGDMGALPTSLPVFRMFDVPFTLETLMILLPLAFTLTFVGLFESLLTAQLVDEMTGTPSNKNVEVRGQGIANIVAGFFGGMAGCAMIGQSVINVRSGGRGRLSSLATGIYLILLILVLTPWMRQIPMGALAAVMMVVAVQTFDWYSLPRLRRQPKSDSIVLIVTMATVVITHNLAIGVIVGVVLSAIFFARKISKQFQVSSSRDGATRTYRVRGQLFFVAIEDFLGSFDFAEAGLERAVVDLTASHVWDSSALAALEAVVQGFRKAGVEVELTGLNVESEQLLDLARMLGAR